MPYLSLAELLENSERLHELPLFVIQETEESIQTPLVTKRGSLRNDSRLKDTVKAKAAETERALLEGPEREGWSGAEQSNSNSFFKITSITQNQLGSAESKPSSLSALQPEPSRGQISQSKKSHFSTENIKMLQKLEHMRGDSGGGDMTRENDKAASKQYIKEELTRQSMQIQQMARVQREILETLRHQSQGRAGKSRRVPKSQFMSVKQRVGPQEEADRDSRNMLMDSTHFNLVRSDVGFDERASLEQAKYSVFNIFQKRVSNETRRSKENLPGQPMADNQRISRRMQGTKNPNTTSNMSMPNNVNNMTNRSPQYNQSMGYNPNSPYGQMSPQYQPNAQSTTPSPTEARPLFGDSPQPPSDHHLNDAKNPRNKPN